MNYLPLRGVCASRRRKLCRLSQFPAKPVHDLASLAILLACFQTSAFANDWFLAQVAGSANKGTNWTHAWTNASSVGFGAGKIMPGDTLYIAGGFDYTNDPTANHYINIPAGKGGTLTQPITFCRARATNSACSSATGWKAAFDAVPILHGFTMVDWSLSGGFTNIVIDGVVPYSGMMITNGWVDAGASTFNIDIRANTMNITLKNCEVVGYGYSDLVTPHESRLWHTVGSPYVAYNSHIHHCIFRNAPTLISGNNEVGTLFEDCIFANTLTGNPAEHHPNVFMLGGGADITVRNSIITNWTVLGVLLTSRCVSNFQMYGTLWVAPNDPGVTTIITPYSVTQGPVYLFNNTFIKPHWYLNAWTNTAWAPGCASSNNIIIFGPARDTTDTFAGQTNNCDYNLSDRPIAGAHSITNAVYTNLFSDFMAFRIVPEVGASLPRDKGVNLGAPYNLDMYGNVRGADGAWDIGAHESAIASAAGPPVTTRPSPPQGVTVITNSPP